MLSLVPEQGPPPSYYCNIAKRAKFARSYSLWSLEEEGGMMVRAMLTQSHPSNASSKTTRVRNYISIGAGTVLMLRDCGVPTSGRE
jgi:hypothetical protein